MEERNYSFFTVSKVLQFLVKKSTDELLKFFNANPFGISRFLHPLYRKKDTIEMIVSKFEVCISRL